MEFILLCVSSSACLCCSGVCGGLGGFRHHREKIRQGASLRKVHSRTAAGGVEVAVRQAGDDGTPFEVHPARIAAGKAHDVVVVSHGEIASVLDSESAHDLRLVLS